MENKTRHIGGIDISYVTLSDRHNRVVENQSLLSLICTFCDKILRYPRQILTCGCRYCESCLQHLAERSDSRCIRDNEIIDLNDTRPDKGAQREIWNLKARCTGCKNWQGGLHEIEDHFKDCIGISEFCGCGERILQKDLERHQAVCPFVDEDFLKGLSEGTGSLTQLNIVLHGPPGAGKTSLKRVILGKPPLPLEEQHSTFIVENAVRAVSLERMRQSDGDLLFEEISDDDMICLLAESVKDQIEHSEPSTKPPAQPCPLMDSDSSSEGKSSKQHSPPLSSLKLESDIIDVQDHQSSINATALNKFDALRLIRDKFTRIKGTKAFFNSKWHHLIDSGGQPQFQDMLPLLYCSPSFQLLLVRLTESLADKPKMGYTVEGKNAIKTPEHLQLTNLQYIERACQIAASCNPPSKVMIVGTHRDKVGVDVESKIRKINTGLKEIRENYRSVLICKSGSETIFDMNTMVEGKERLVLTKDLQQIINEVSKKLSKMQSVPFKWLSYQLAIGNEEGVVSLKDCLENGQELGLDVANSQKALMYFNETGLVLYYPNDVPDLVLTKVDPLVNRLSQLVKASFLPPNQVLANECEQLQKKGVFTVDFFNQLFPDTEKYNLLDNSKFLHMLLCLKLAAKVGPDEYFLPSALSDHQHITTIHKLSCGFTLSNDKRIMPHGFFFTTVIELIDDSSHFNFQLRKDDQQYRNQVQLRDENRNIPGVVILTDKTWWIQVSMTSDNHSHCPALHKAMKGAIRRSINRLKHICITSFQRVFPCPRNDHGDHYCNLTANEKEYVCSDDVSLTGPVTQGIMYWITNFASNEKCEVLTHAKIFDFLKSKSSKWDDIGRCLGVELNDREILRHDNSRTTENKLECVINTWVQSRCSPVTLGDFIQLLEEMGYRDIISQIGTNSNSSFEKDAVFIPDEPLGSDDDYDIISSPEEGQPGDDIEPKSLSTSQCYVA